MPGITDSVVFENRICFMLGIDIPMYCPWPWYGAVGWPQVLGEHGIGCRARWEVWVSREPPQIGCLPFFSGPLWDFVSQ